MNPEAAFSDALARARQIAAKITKPITNDEIGALKRPYDGMGDQPDAKKLAGNVDPLKAMADKQRAAQAALAAAAINAKLSGSTNGIGSMAAQSNLLLGQLGVPITETITVPDRMVGLIIGKGGEQITTIQSVTGCKVQFAPDSAGQAERMCTLSGTRDSVSKAKDMIQSIVMKEGTFRQSFGASNSGGGGGFGFDGGATNSYGGGGTTTIELMIPGPKAGLIIGKGGETIKQLQEKAGVRMTVIQDSNQPSFQDKPLKITGDAAKCQKAKELVMELLMDKDVLLHGGVGLIQLQQQHQQQNHNSSNNSGRVNLLEMAVPRSMVGIVIGKNGENIKKITMESGAKVQFKPDDGQSPDRVAVITGPGDAPRQASNMINDTMSNAVNEGRGGAMPPMNRSSSGGFNSMSDGMGGNAAAVRETTFSIPAEKTGIVIGRGGENIKEINRVSGAFVGMSRQSHPNPSERIVNIKGTPDQIQNAIHMICDKAGLPVPNSVNGLPSQQQQQYGNASLGSLQATQQQQLVLAAAAFSQFAAGLQRLPSFGTGQQSYPVQQQGAPPGMQSMSLQQAAQQVQAPPPAQQQQMPGGYAQQPPAMLQVAAAPTWGATAGYPSAPTGAMTSWGQPAVSAAPVPDQNIQDPWAAYYAQMYALQAQPQQSLTPQQPQAPPPLPQQQQPQAQTMQQQQNYSYQSTNIAAAVPQQQQQQPDYSAAWAEYYRQQGLHNQAQAILANSQQQATGGGHMGAPHH